MHHKTVSMAARVGARLRRLARYAVLVVPAVAGLSSEAIAGFVVFESAGANPAAITPTRDAFRSAVGGGTTAGANGNFGGLRREINWDGVPNARSDPNLLPANFFNVNSPRGAVFSTPGTGFLVSANAGLATSTLFGFPGDLQTFSAQRLFAQLGSNVMDVHFFVPGTTIASSTGAFAAIFVDVEENNAVDATTMEFFDQFGALIFSRTALAAGNQGLSFLGAVADAGERIGRVRITTPENFLKSNGDRDNNTTDFVVMDDFLYATPIPIPGTLALSLLGLGILGWVRRKQA